MSGLVASDLSLRLGGAQVLRDVSCAFVAGQVSAIVGPNGAGKSSLLACLAALRESDAGNVVLDGKAVGEMAPHERARAIGFLPQTPEIHWGVDVRTLVCLGRFAHRGAFAGESAFDRAAVAEAMDAMQVAHFAARPVSSLSGGERARVLIARVLAGRPDWILADEPLANLDIGHQLELLTALRRAAHERGMGVVTVLHDLAHAMNFADHAVMLDRGCVLTAGAPEIVLTSEHIESVYGVAVRWLGEPGIRTLQTESRV